MTAQRALQGMLGPARVKLRGPDRHPRRRGGSGRTGLHRTRCPSNRASDGRRARRAGTPDPSGEGSRPWQRHRPDRVPRSRHPLPSGLASARTPLSAPGAGLASDFPPLRTQTAAAKSRLPTFLTRFIGRSREIAEVGDVLDASDWSRSPVPAGPARPGSRSRSPQSSSDYSDGIWFVALDAVHDGRSSSPRSRRPSAYRTARTADRAVLAEILPTRRMLLSRQPGAGHRGGADSAACSLRRGPGHPCHGREPLSSPASRSIRCNRSTFRGARRADGPGVGANEAVQLFVERARLRSDFTLTDANAPAVAPSADAGRPAPCHRIGCRPQQPPLSGSDRHPTGSSLDTPGDVTSRPPGPAAHVARRHRLELRPAVRAGADVLPALQCLLGRCRPRRRPGGRRPGWAARHRRAGSHIGLVDRSLMRSTRTGDANRLDMLETIREYAIEHLAASLEDDSDTRARHAGYYRDLAQARRASSRMLTARRYLTASTESSPTSGRPSPGRWKPGPGDRSADRRRPAGILAMRNHLLEGRQAIRELLDASVDAGATPLQFQRSDQRHARVVAWRLRHGW